MAFFSTTTDDKNDWVDWAVYLLTLMVVGGAAAFVLFILGVSTALGVVISVVVAAGVAYYLTRGEPKEVPKTGKG